MWRHGLQELGQRESLECKSYLKQRIEGGEDIGRKAAARGFFPPEAGGRSSAGAEKPVVLQKCGESNEAVGVVALMRALECLFTARREFLGSVSRVCAEKLGGWRATQFPHPPHPPPASKGSSSPTKARGSPRRGCR